MDLDIQSTMKKIGAKMEPYHIYAKAGNYNVTLTKTVNGEVKEPITKEHISN